MSFLESIQSGSTVFAAELRPPRTGLGSTEGMDAWIDTYHSVRTLTRQGAAEDRFANGLYQINVCAPGR